MEFKEKYRVFRPALFLVDVETEWNLKACHAMHALPRHTVDVETEWNLKGFPVTVPATSTVVDVETEWNLKQKATMPSTSSRSG